MFVPSFYLLCMITKPQPKLEHEFIRVLANLVTLSWLPALL